MLYSPVLVNASKHLHYVDHITSYNLSTGSLFVLRRTTKLQTNVVDLSNAPDVFSASCEALDAGSGLARVTVVTSVPLTSAGDAAGPAAGVGPFDIVLAQSPSRAQQLSNTTLSAGMNDLPHPLPPTVPSGPIVAPGRGGAGLSGTSANATTTAQPSEVPHPVTAIRIGTILWGGTRWRGCQFQNGTMASTNISHVVITAPSLASPRTHFFVSFAFSHCDMYREHGIACTCGACGCQSIIVPLNCCLVD